MREVGFAVVWLSGEEWSASGVSSYFLIQLKPCYLVRCLSLYIYLTNHISGFDWSVGWLA